MAMTTLRLKKREQRRVAAGHDWIFSNEIDTAATPLKGVTPGTAVVVESANGQFMGHAYVNPHSLIALRITSRRANKPFTADTLRERLIAALELRQRRYAAPYYRWVHSEGDGLPGLVVDRYDNVCVVQITTAGMEVFRDDIVEHIAALIDCTAILLRNDASVRELEHLPLYREWQLGDPVESLVVVENGLSFEVPAEISQKTGWFFDHRESRAALAPWVKDCRVLDVYTYLGGFALNAAQAGAREVVAIDSSDVATTAASENAERNGFGKQFSAICGDGVETMRSLFKADERFDVVVLDPPAFIKRRKDREAGTRHYALNNRLAMRLLKPGGILLTASCSQALSDKELVQVVRQNAPPKSRGVQVLAPLSQGPDHPVHIAMPETHYIGGVSARILPNS